MFGCSELHEWTKCGYRWGAQRLVGRFLVTTALEETWPDSNEPVLFLGEWCRLYSRKTAWEHLDALVAPYHWDDRERLYKDYLYLQGLYEELLVELTAKLNAIHDVNHSVRYWRIIIGPWLGYFIQMLFDRWAMVQQVVRDEAIVGAKVLQRRQDRLVPNDMESFVTLFIGDEWNELIYGQILDSMEIPVERIAAHGSEHASLVTPNSANSTRRLRRALLKVATHISGFLCRDNEFFFISSYLGIKQDLLLQAKLGQLPKIWRTVPVPTAPVDPHARRWDLPALNSARFPSLARKLISKHIPTVYLEGYQNLVDLTASLPWPKRPKCIFTSNAFISDDVFKVWAAEKTESGTPMVIGQHGGNYGMALWSFTEDHQIAIADRFLTWGWSESGPSKISPVGNFKDFGRKMIADMAGNALLVETTVPQSSYHMYSVPVAAGQWQSYFEDQCRFVQALPTALRDQVLVRLYSKDYGYCQRKRWIDRFPTIELDDGLQPLAMLMSKARLYISTYNATTYLESLSLNFPTIMFWNPKHWELRDSAVPYIELLKSVGIFHETPENAARQMAKVWDDVPTWWQSGEVQSVRGEFCERYAYTPNKPLYRMGKLLRTIADGRGETLGINVSSEGPF